MSEKKLNLTTVDLTDCIKDQHTAFMLIQVIRCILESTKRAEFKEFFDSGDHQVFRMSTYSVGDYTQAQLSAKHLINSTYGSSSLSGMSVKQLMNSYRKTLARMANLDVIMLLDKSIGEINLAYFDQTIKKLDWKIDSKYDTNYASTYVLTINETTSLEIICLGFSYRHDVSEIVFGIIMAMGLMDRMTFTGLPQYKCHQSIPAHIKEVWNDWLFQTADENMTAVLSNLRWLEHHLNMGLKLRCGGNNHRLMTPKVLDRLIDRSVSLGTNEATMFLLRYGEEHGLRKKEGKMRL